MSSRLRFSPAFAYASLLLVFVLAVCAVLGQRSVQAGDQPRWKPASRPLISTQEVAADRAGAPAPVVAARHGGGVAAR